MVHDSTNRNTLMSQDMCISVTESRPQQPMLFWTNIKKSGAKFLYNAVKDRYHPKMIFQVIAAKSGSTSYKIMGVLNFSQDCKDSCQNSLSYLCEYVWIYTYRASKLGKCFLISLKLQLRSCIKQFIGDVESARLTNKPGGYKTDLSVQVWKHKKKMHKRTRIQESAKH